MATGGIVSYLHGPSIIDASGLGRWSGFSIRGSNSQYLSIITAYRTCTGSIWQAKVGSTFHWEYKHFCSTGISGPCPRTLFLQDLKTQIQLLQSRQHLIILMLDANATIESDIPFSTMLSEYNLHDLHASSPAPSTYMDAANRKIDYMFGCHHVQQITRRQRMLSYYEDPQADHRGLFIDVDLHHLLGIQSQPATNPSSQLRLLKSGNPEHVISYKEAIHQYYSEHWMMDCLKRIHKNHHKYSRSRLRRMLDAWNEDQGRAMKHAESILRRPPQKYPWSAELRNCGILRQYWRLRLRKSTQTENHSQIFHRMQRQIQAEDPSFQLPHLDAALPESDIRLHLNAATRALSICQKSATDIRYRSY